MGGMGRGGQGGGMEMMMSVLCCVCCVSLVCIFAGYYFNLFCGVSKSLGKGCPADAPTNTEPPYDPNVTTGPVNPYAANMCNPTYQGESRAANDPRPPINATACVGQTTRITGGDCFYWTTQSDPMTGLARWVRVPDEPGKADSKNAACKPTVNCPVVLDFAATDMAGYRNNNAAPLLKKCTPVVVGGATKASMVPIITAAAKSAGVVTNGVKWSNAQSSLWVNRMATALAGRNISAHINNTATAAKTVKTKLNQTYISNQTFAAMLEAAVISVNNQADWISSVAINTWAGQPTNAYLSEAGLVKYLVTVSKPRALQSWSSIINNPDALRTAV